MNITPISIYFWQQADALGNGFGGLAAIFFMMTVIICLLCFVMEESAYMKHLKFTIPLFFLCIILKGVMPSSKTVAMMYVIPAVANSAPIQRDLPELYDMAVGALKEYLKKP